MQITPKGIENLLTQALIRLAVIMTIIEYMDHCHAPFHSALF